MRKIAVILSLSAIIIALVSFTKTGADAEAENLRRIYSRPPSEWPAPNVDGAVGWQELGVLPQSPLAGKMDSLKPLIELGKTLFFDTRLSGSGKISCATCHRPELNWTDGHEKSLGHEGTLNKRNSPTIQNTWFYKKLFWDGRARDLEDQAFAPINSESEMHGDMRELPFKLRQVKGYKPLFGSAFGDARIDPDRIALAIATFEKTIVSNKTRFDEFLEGKRNALTKPELRGLHIFRTKANCMGCHNGPLFTDNKFHKSIFSTDGDDGLAKQTRKPEDQGKFKTPSLRDVARTGPWGHGGHFKHLSGILVTYNKMSPSPGGGPQRMLNLNKGELSDLQAFLEAISVKPVPFTEPILPE